MKRIAVSILAASIGMPAASMAHPAPGADADAAHVGPTDPWTARAYRDGSLRAAVAAYKADPAALDTPAGRTDGPAPHLRRERNARAAAPATAQTAKKSVWQTPWPYVAIGGAAVLLIIVATRSDSY